MLVDTYINQHFYYQVGKLSNYLISLPHFLIFKFANSLIIPSPFRHTPP